MTLSSASETATKVDHKLLEYRTLVYRSQERDARITALVLGFLTLFLFACSAILFGLGTLSPTFLMGLGIFPYFGGAVLSFIALGILCGTLVFVAIASVRSCQKKKQEALLKHPL